MQEFTVLLVGDEAEWYDFGQMAWEDGIPRDGCPYKKGSIESEYWLRGYDDIVNEYK
jgi:hypothetical protein